MIDAWLEEPCDDPRLCTWNMVWLIDLFKEEVLKPLMHSCWAIDEMDAGVPAETIEDDIWKGYEKWAEEKLYDGYGYEECMDYE